MNAALDPRIAARIRAVAGLDMADNLVLRAVKRRIGELGLSGMADYARLLLGSAAELTELIDLLVIPETWFFRDPAAFAQAVQAVQGLKGLGRRARLLSLPCSTGEEPYSLAMALLDTGLGEADFQVEGWDISLPSLARAQRAVYGRNSFRGQDLAFRERHFNAVEGGHALMERVRQRVSFHPQNILQLDSTLLAGQYDLVFCRNLLIYFDPPTQGRAIANLRALLSEQGLLFAGFAEMNVCAQHGFVGAGGAQPAAMRKASTSPAIGRVPKALPARTPAASGLRPRLAGSAGRSPSSLPARPATPLLPAKAPPAVSPDHLLQQARQQADAGQLGAAQASLRSHLQQAPESAEAWFLLGLLLEGEAPAEAARLLRRAIYLEPAHYQALCHLALLCEQQGDGAQAAQLRARAGRVQTRADAGGADAGRAEPNKGA
ncbi:MAG: CheR family methyltransferase [Pseudomonadota bacterium]